MKNVPAKPRIALLAMAVMGGGTLNDGIPVLADLFDRLSQHFEIVFYSFQKVHRTNIPSSIQVKEVTGLALPGRLKYFLLFLRILLDNLRNPYQLLFAISIHPPGRIAVLLGELFRRPVVVQIIALEAVAMPEINSGNLTIPWLARVTRRVCKKTNHLVAVSDYQARVAKNDLPTSREIAVLPLRINATRFKFQERVVSYPVQLIHIGYFSPIKGQDVMFRAFAELTRSVDCHLTVIGDGFNVPVVKEMLLELGIQDRVFFKGPVLQSEIPVHFTDKHIMVHAARYETGCAVIQEAMASGVAVCGTRVGLLSDIGDNYAMIVPSEDYIKLAEKIHALIADPVLYSRITREAYEWISNYDAAWSAAAYHNFITSKLPGM
jgi:glycosyltransferase involved in cell wall biosynthesis